jgi:hypothetical protein
MKTTPHITGLPIKRILLYVYVISIAVFYYADITFAQDEIITNDDILFSQYNTGLFATNGSITLDSLHINSSQKWEFVSPTKIAILPGTRLEGHVKLTKGLCGFLGGPCCGTGGGCSSGLTCANNNCVQDARGFVYILAVARLVKVERILR